MEFRNPQIQNNEEEVTYIPKAQRSLEENFNELMAFLKLKYYKKNYKLIVNQIEKSKKYFLELKCVWKLNVIKIKSLIKIIKHKLRKKGDILKNFRANDRRTSSTGTIRAVRRRSSVLERPENVHTLNEFAKWFDMLNTELEDFKKYLKIFDDVQVIKDTDLVEDFVVCQLYYINIKCSFLECMGNFVESFGMLLVGKRLIENYDPFIRNPITLRYSSYIYLRLSKILIENLDFYYARQFLELAYNLCIRQIALTLEDLNMLEIKNKLHKVFLTLSLVYFYIGIINEYEGHTVNSVYSYQQCQWLSGKLLINKYPRITAVFYKTFKRSKNYVETFKFILKEERLYEIAKAKIAKDILKKKTTGKQYSERMLGLKKNKLLEEYLENLNIPKIDGIDINVKHFKEKPSGPPSKSHVQSPSHQKEEGGTHYTDYILSTMRLVNVYFSNEFKPVINTMNKINIADIDYNTSQEISRNVNKKNFRNEMKFLSKKKGVSTRNKNRTVSHKSDTSLIHFSQSISSEQTFPTVFKCQSTKNMPISIKKSFKNTVSTISDKPIKKKPTHLDFRSIHTGKVIKYDCMRKSFEYSKAFKKKKEYLYNLNNKETAFLKKLLVLKKNESVIIDDSSFDAKLEAEKKYKTLRAMVQPEKEKNKVSITLLEMKEKNRRKSAENIALKSLDLRKLSLDPNLLDLLTRNGKEKQHEDNLKYEKPEYLEENNVNFLKRITSEIAKISSEEKKIKRNAKVKFFSRQQSKKYFSMPSKIRKRTFSFDCLEEVRTESNV